MRKRAEGNSGAGTTKRVERTRLVDRFMPPGRRGDPDVWANTQLVVRISAIGMAIGISFALCSILLVRSWAFAASLFVATVFVGLAPWAYRKTDNLAVAAHLFVGTLLGIVCVSGLFRGALPLSALTFTLAIPLLAFYLAGFRVALGWTLSALVVIAGYTTLAMADALPTSLAVDASADFWRVVDGSGIAVVLVTLFLISTWYEKKRQLSEQLRRRAEAALQQSEKMESIGRLAGGIAHDFNNTLAVVGLIAENTHDQAKDDDLREDMTDVLKAVKRSSELTRQLLLFSRSDHGESDPGSVPEAAEGVVTLLNRGLPANIELTMKCDKDVPIVRANTTAVWQILLNLGVNARDAMPDGGELSIRAEVVQVGEHQAGVLGITPARYVRMRVSDTGGGVPEELRDRIFEPFFTTKGQSKGTGLGLATVYAIATRAGGTVLLESSPAGSIFDVYLGTNPPKRRRASTQMPVVSQKSGEHLFVLLVEDDGRVRKATRRILRNQGHEVVDVGSGHEALDVIESRGDEVDVVLTDIVMPGLSGQDLADKIWQSGRQLPVLFMSGYTGSEASVAEELLLRKPFGRDQLISHLNRVVRG